MRTTITLDPDVLAGADALRRAGASSWSSVLNQLAREGLARRKQAPPAPFHQQTFSSDLLVDMTHMGDALDLLDGYDHT